MERHVCTLEQAKELKELGIIQESQFYHMINCDPLTPQAIAQYWQYSDPEEKYSAYSVSELGLMLPPGSWSCIIPNKGGWTCFVAGSYSLERVYTTEAESRAEKLIQLLKDGKIKVSQVNERLGAVVV